MFEWQVVAVPFSSEPGHDMWRGPETILNHLGIEPDIWTPVPVQEATVGAWQALAQSFRDQMAPRLKTDRLWLVLSGECTVAPLPVGALQRAFGPTQVIWIDAHGDIHTPASSTSHFLGGMPLNCLMGGSLTEVREAAGAQPVQVDQVTMVGTRDLDPPEAALIQDLGIVRLNQPQAIRERIQAVGLPAYVHVDIDVLDPIVNPAASYPSPSGLSVEQLLATLDAIGSSGLMRAVTVTAYSPGLDREQQGLRAAARVVQSLLEPGH